MTQMQKAPPDASATRLWLPWAALVVVYLVWGSTYLGIAVGVETIPPLTLAGVRYLIAGALLYPFVARKGKAVDSNRGRQGRHWAMAAVVGALTLGVGNGGLTYAEQTVPSGLAAVLVATVPLWMIAADRVINGQPVGLVKCAALVTGLIGVGILVQPGSQGGNLSGQIVLVIASASWAIGSVVSGRLNLPSNPLRSAAMQMLTGGALLLVVAGLAGEFGDLQLEQVSARSWLALLYLIGPGSILALTAYVVALQTLPMATVATYAYVNPVVAVALGALLLQEPITRLLLLGSAIIIVGVAISLWPTKPAGNVESP